MLSTQLLQPVPLNRRVRARENRLDPWAHCDNLEETRRGHLREEPYIAKVKSMDEEFGLGWTKVGLDQLAANLTHVAGDEAVDVTDELDVRLRDVHWEVEKQKLEKEPWPLKSLNIDGNLNLFSRGF